MNEKNNLIGKKFGKLTVIEKAENTKRSSWLCQCECGKYKIVRYDSLKAGTTKSCGCLHQEVLYNLNKRDLLGKTFGKLTVIEETLERDKNTRNIIWKCKCECGNIIFLPTSSLTTGHTQSCGCLKSQGEQHIVQLLINNNIPYQKEKTFKDCIFPDSGRMAKFDFYIDNKYIIEFDGEQHYTSIKYFGGDKKFKETIEHDNFKNQWCKNHNIPLIRIPYNHKNICLEDLILSTSKFLIKN